MSNRPISVNAIPPYGGHGLITHCLPAITGLACIMLYTIVVVLVIFWLLGFIGHIGGGLIHLLLVIAVVVLLFNFISGRR